MMRERVWLWSGSVLFALSTALLLWAWYQRYRVLTLPGVII
jgi:hypothetical protein